MDFSTHIDRPFRIGFLLFDGFALIAYSSALSPLMVANELSGQELYSIRNLPASGSQAVSSSGAVIKADAFPGEHVDFDLIIAVGGYVTKDFDSPRILQWLRLLSRRNVMIGGISGGPVVLAKAGIMNERRMTVHWVFADLIAEMDPDILLERALYVFDRDRLTCAGGLAPVDMMHALIAKHHSPAFARDVSDYIMHTNVRPGEGPQRSGLVERYGVNNPAVITAIEVMQNNLSEPLTLAQLARSVGLGTRQLNRQFKDKMGESTMGFYKKLRLEKASNFLKQTTLSITDIAFATGYVSSAHFSRDFREKFGIAPSDYRSADHRSGEA
ncbi:GlxA family transcriptional regulator [Lentilitoribacter sp. Alg239-R112]|uniref:GlxA family transcriptional regulator n=1 Tax=Lentilitoribacter sp. Alg239-R112 TaxID=2305987 RepID=UPI0013A69297|nr:GlxA family transcriptional regulator [Lentilitoribacter sp. Alg239-R112]